MVPDTAAQLPAGCFPCLVGWGKYNASKESRLLPESAADVAAVYFEAWRAADFTRLRAILADDATFEGPLGRANGADELVAGLRRMSEIVTDIVVRKTFVDGPDVLTWFDMHTASTPPLPTVNWRHVENGKITAVRVTFDPRPLAPPAGR
jgi:SnoaL-like protein